MRGLRTGALLLLDEKKQATVYSISKCLDCHTSTATEILESFRHNGLVTRKETDRKEPVRGTAVLSYRGAKPYTLANKGKRLLQFIKYIEGHDLLPSGREFDAPLNEDSSFVAELLKGGFSSDDFEDAISCGLVHEEKVEREPGHRYTRGLSTPDKMEMPVARVHLVVVKYRYHMK
jgi:hypothetical protein